MGRSWEGHENQLADLKGNLPVHSYRGPTTEPEQTSVGRLKSMNHVLKIECGWCNSPSKWCNVKNVWQTFWDLQTENHPLTAFSCQGGLQQYGSQQNGGWNLTMCAVNVIPASAHTKRFMDKKPDKNIIPMVSMWTWSNYHVSPWITSRLLIWRFDQQNSG